MAASVTIHHSVWGDDRYVALATIARYPGGVDQAIAKMARLWSVCTELQTDTPPVGRIRTCLGGLEAEEWLIGAELGERVSADLVRVRGCDGRIDWFGALQSAQSKAGKARAAGAQRDQRGRLISRIAGPKLVGAEAALDQLPDISSSGTPASPALDPDLPEYRAVSVSASPPDLGGPRVERVHAASRAAIRSAGAVAPPAPVNAAAALRRSLLDAFVDRVNAARQHLATELKLSDVRPIALMGEGEKALMERLKESADPVADMDHVLKVAAAEARRTRELRWFGWSLAEPKAWRTRLAATLQEAKSGPRDQRRIEPRSQPTPEKFAPEPAFEMTDEDRAARDELAAKLASGNYDPDGDE